MAFLLHCILKTQRVLQVASVHCCEEESSERCCLPAGRGYIQTMVDTIIGRGLLEEFDAQVSGRTLMPVL